MREYNYEILDLIVKRWSPRAFSKKPVPKEDLMAILEAARYAPSCFNEQPWRFMVADDPKSLEVMRKVLMEKNYLWAKNAPVLILMLSKKQYEKNGKDNKYHDFDTGTAWGFLSLEAVRRGYQTHGMAGIKKKEARELFKIPEDIHIIGMIALGINGSIEDLDDMFIEDESPSSRKPLEDIVLRVDTFNDEIID